MRILWLSHNVPYPPVGGVLQRNFNLLRVVASRHHVHLVAFNQRALLPTSRDVEEARRALETLCARVDIVPIASDSSRAAWYRLALRSLMTRDPYTINWLKSSRMHATINAAVQREPFDLVHYDTIGLVEYFPDTGHAPKVLNHHNIESFMLRRRAQREASPFRRFYFRHEADRLQRCEEVYGSRADLNLTVSRLDGHRLRQISPDANIEVCENGTDPAYFRPGHPALVDDAHLLFIGGLKWYPNRDAMLYFCREVWPRLVKQTPALRLTIVGAQPPVELQRLSAADRRIRLEGYVDDVRPYFHRATILICPIRDGGGTRLKILDAMAMGKPIVTTTLGCEGIDLIPGTHALVADSPEDFAVRIRELLGNATLRADLGACARRLVERQYAWELIGQRLLTHYEGLLAARASRAPRVLSDV